MLKIYNDSLKIWTNETHLLPYTINLKKDESLDTAVIQRFIKRDTKLKPLTKIKIVDGDITTDWIVDNCTNERVAKGLYIQTLDLIEPTEMLKGYVLDNLTITQPIEEGRQQKLIMSEIDRLIILTMNNYPKFNLLYDNNLVNTLAAIYSPEFWFTDYTLFDAFIEIGSYLDMMPRVWINDDADYVLDFEELDYRNKTNYIIDDFIEEQSQQPLSKFANTVTSKVSNLSVSDLIVYPSETLGVYPNSPDGTNITESNCVITLPTKIQEIVKFEFSPKGAGYFWYDYTEHCLEHGDFLKIEPNVQAKDKAYYRYNTNTIENLLGFFRNVERDFTNDPRLQPRLLQCVFRITYRPLMDSKVYANNDDTIDYSVIYNQKGNVIDSKSYARHLDNYIKRLKHGDMVKDKIYNTLSDMPQLGHLVNNNYVLTNLSYTKFKTHYQATMQLSEGYTRRAEFIRAKQEIRNWEIPADGQVVNRNVTKYEEVYFSFKPMSKTANTSIIDFDKTFALLTNTSVDRNFIFVLNFNTINGSIPIVMTATKGEFGDSRIMYFKCFDNTVIGSNKVTGVIDGNFWSGDPNYIGVISDWGVTYTDQYGNFETVDIGLVNDFDDIFEDAQAFAENYPLSNHTDNTTLFNRASAKIEDYTILKDAREVFSFTYQLRVKGENTTIVRNGMVNSIFNTNDSSDIDLKAIFLNKQLKNTYEEIFEQDIVFQTFVSNVTVHSNYITYEIVLKPSTEYQALALTDRNNNILLIENDPNSMIRDNINNYNRINIFFSA